MLLGSRSFDAGRILENVVYLELLHRQKKVYIGKQDDLEVDLLPLMKAISLIIKWRQR